MGLMDTLHFYLMENIDQRVADWPLVRSLYTVPIFCLLYLFFVFHLGPLYMKDRKPYSLKRFIQFFDVFQIIANALIVYRILDGNWYQDVWIYCAPALYSTDPGPMKIANAMWWTTILKLVDLIETGIYVLRKKDRQISFLHLYHHISTVLLGWMFLRYVAIGMAAFVPLVNCSVHVIMYTYYFLATFGPKVQKMILPYKPILTITQMTQFIMLMLHTSQSLMPSCDVPKLPGPVMIVNLMINFYLFYDFYQNTYKAPKAKKN